MVIFDINDLLFLTKNVCVLNIFYTLEYILYKTYLWVTLYFYEKALE